MDSYVDALKAFPKTDVKLQTEKGTASCQKIDIFKGLLWYTYDGEMMNWHVLTVEHANEIITANKNKEKVAGLEEYAAELIIDVKTDFENVVGQDSLTRFDQPKRNNRRKNKRKKGGSKGKGGHVKNTANGPKNKGQNPKRKKPQKAKPKEGATTETAVKPARKNNKNRRNKNRNQQRNKAKGATKPQSKSKDNA